MRYFFRFGARTLAGYLLIIVLLMFLENRLVFHPYTAADSWQPPPNHLVKDVTFPIPGNISIHGWWCPTPNWTPSQGALIYCQGNGGNLSMRVPAISQWLSKFKTSVLIFDYPGFGQSSGAPSEQGCYDAAQAAYDWLTKNQKVPPEKVLIYGASLGGGVATDLASRQPHRALVLLMTFSSLPEAAQFHYPWLPARWLVRNQFNNLAKIGKCAGPIFIAHGTADPVVPYALGRRLYEAAPEPKFFLPLEGRGHDEALEDSFFEALADFLKKNETALAPAR
jgi:fermentation-respiration switch protein FrsA (DUF1100 family)